MNRLALFCFPVPVLVGLLSLQQLYVSSPLPLHPEATREKLTTVIDTSVVQWLTEKDHDFGNMHQGRPLEFEFKFKNTSPEPFVLQNARTTCGCTAARWTEGPISPGETGSIFVEYDAYHTGDFEKKIKVYFSTQRRAEVLYVRGTVK